MFLHLLKKILSIAIAYEESQNNNYTSYNSSVWLTRFLSKYIDHLPSNYIDGMTFQFQLMLNVVFRQWGENKNPRQTEKTIISCAINRKKQ